MEDKFDFLVNYYLSKFCESVWEMSITRSELESRIQAKEKKGYRAEIIGVVKCK